MQLFYFIKSEIKNKQFLCTHKYFLIFVDFVDELLNSRTQYLFCLFVYYLFNDAVSSSGCIALDARTIRK
jgi:hypothetical protein